MGASVKASSLEIAIDGVTLTKPEEGRLVQVLQPGHTYARHLVIRGCGYGMMVGLRRELLSAYPMPGWH